MRAHEFITESVKQRLDPHCWKGKHKAGTKIKNGVRVNNCVPNEQVEEKMLPTSAFAGTEKGYKLGPAAHLKGKMKRPAQAGDLVGGDESMSLDEQFDLIEDMVESLAWEYGVDPEQLWEDFESIDDHELYESAAWHRKAGKSKTGGLNDKGIASYRRENPGSKLQKAVTTKPSKLKPGSKAAKRRKSFCARMGGVDGPMKKPNGKPTRKALALRKWNC